MCGSDNLVETDNSVICQLVKVLVVNAQVAGVNLNRIIKAHLVLKGLDELIFIAKKAEVGLLATASA